jgi:hypothetical protein
LTAIRRAPEPFRLADLQQARPGVSVDMIRRILKREQAARRVACLGRGPAAAWRRLPARTKASGRPRRDK